MTVAEEAKRAGYKSLAELAELSNKSTQGLRYWHKHNYTLFEAVLNGCKPKLTKSRKKKV